MKKILILVLFIAFKLTCTAQYKLTDYNIYTVKSSFKDSISYMNLLPEGNEKAMLEIRACWYYFYTKSDSTLYYAKRAESYAKKLDIRAMSAYVHMLLAEHYLLLKSNSSLGLHYSTLALNEAEENNISNSFFEGSVRMIQIGCYAGLGSYTKVKRILVGTGVQSIRNAHNSSIMWTPEGMIGFYYSNIKEYDSALKYSIIAIGNNKKVVKELNWGFPYFVAGYSYLNKKEYNKAIDIIHSGIDLLKSNNFEKDIAETYNVLAESHYGLNHLDSAEYYARVAFSLAKKVNYTTAILDASGLLAKTFKARHQIDSAYNYLSISNTIKDELSDKSKINDAENITLNEELRIQQKEEDAARRKKLIIGFSLFFIIGFSTLIIYTRVKQKNKIHQIEEVRKNKELQAAKDLQLSLLPKKNPKRDDLDIATFIRSSTEVGGDYYDFDVQKDGRIISICGDATGHGVASGMMVSVTKASLKGLGNSKPNELLQRLNNVVKDVDLGTLRMSLNVAEIGQSEVRISSAAMPPIYLYKAASNTIEEFMNNGLPLGGLRDEVFELVTRNFETGDVLIQLSDGLPEAPNAKGEMYDYERLKSLIQDSCHLSAQEIINVLIQSVDQWMEGKHNPDDITIVITKKK